MVESAQLEQYLWHGGYTIHARDAGLSLLRQRAL